MDSSFRAASVAQEALDTGPVHPQAGNSLQRLFHPL